MNKFYFLTMLAIVSNQISPCIVHSVLQPNFCEEKIIQALIKNDKNTLSTLTTQALRAGASPHEVLLYDDLRPLEDKGVTLLHFIAAANQTKIMQLFLEPGDDFTVNPNIQDSFGETPLHHAAFSGSLETVNCLLKQKNICVDAVNYDNETPLWVSASYGQLPVMKTLLNHGARWNKVDKHGNSLLHTATEVEVVNYLLKNFKGAINTQNNSGTTPLHTAVEEQRLLVLLRLLQHGADPTIKDYFDSSPLDTGQLTAEETLHTPANQIVRILVGAEWNKYSNPSTSFTEYFAINENNIDPYFDYELGKISQIFSKKTWHQDLANEWKNTDDKEKLISTILEAAAIEEKTIPPLKEIIHNNQLFDLLLLRCLVEIGKDDEYRKFFLQIKPRMAELEEFNLRAIPQTEEIIKSRFLAYTSTTPLSDINIITPGHNRKRKRSNKVVFQKHKQPKALD